MTDSDKTPLTDEQVARAGLSGWQQRQERLVVRYETGGFSNGAALIVRIAETADEANHHPDVDLRYPHVTVALTSHDVGALTDRDLRLARRISALAAEADMAVGALD